MRSADSSAKRHQATIEHAVTRLHRATARGICQRSRRDRARCSPPAPRILTSRCSRAMCEQLLADPPPPPAILQALLERVRDHLLTQGGEPRKRLVARIGRRTSARHATTTVISAFVQALGPYLVQALDELPSRHQPRAGPRRAAALRHRPPGIRADAAQAWRARLFGRCWNARCACWHRWRSSRAAASSSKRATSTCWSTSFRTPAARSGSWSSCWSDRGRRVSVSPTREPTIFIVGDRKQSIYGFRDAEVAVLDEAARYIEALRPIGQRPHRDHAQLSLGASAAALRQRCLCGDRQGAGPRRRIPLFGGRHVSVERGRGVGARSARPRGRGFGRGAGRSGGR